MNHLQIDAASTQAFEERAGQLSLIAILNLSRVSIIIIACLFVLGQFT